MNENLHPITFDGCVDIVIPAFGEPGAALEATLDACLRQFQTVSQILVIDDGSPVPVVIPERILSSGKVQLWRMAENRGIAAARNFAIARSTAAWVACINCEVLPAPDWLQSCSCHLYEHPRVAACFSRMVPHNPKRLLSRWRMRFQETNFGDHSRSASAPGHAVLFRREALDSVAAYDVRFRRVREDCDICERLENAGWEIHYLNQSRCTSIQNDDLPMLSRKALARSDWHSPDDYSFPKVVIDQSRWLVMRLGRNLVKLRFYFWPIDVAVWFGAIGIAAASFLQLRTRSGPQEFPTLRRN